MKKGLREKRESWFAYVGEIPPDVMAEIADNLRYGTWAFRIPDNAGGRTMAAQLQQIVEDILQTGQWPGSYTDITDVSIGPGVLFGEAVCRGHGWKWQAFGPGEDDVYFGIVSPKGNYCCAPMQYIEGILRGQNIGPDGCNDNTVELLYNMLEGMDNRPQEKMYVPLR